MREHLFRAKTVYDNLWVEGYYVNQYNSYEIYCSDTSVSEMYHIQPETVCEYTGLIDNKDIRVYENDIVKTRYLFHSIVGVIKSEVGCYWIEVSKQERYLLLSCDAKHFEVIGNIFDNADLLEGGGEE